MDWAVRLVCGSLKRSRNQKGPRTRFRPDLRWICAGFALDLPCVSTKRLNFSLFGFHTKKKSTLGRWKVGNEPSIQ